MQYLKLQFDNMKILLGLWTSKVFFFIWNTIKKILPAMNHIMQSSETFFFKQRKFQMKVYTTGLLFL